MTAGTRPAPDLNHAGQARGPYLPCHFLGVSDSEPCLTVRPLARNWTAPSDARKNDMVARHAVAVVTLLSFSPALAENLDAEAAGRFIVGKLFTFTCADGSRGVARVYDDGSVIGTIQFHGSEQPRPVWLPAETLKLTGETVCASLNRTELCFALSKTSDQSFRASVTGLDFAYCDFTERVRTPDTVPRPEPSEPLSLDPPRDGAVH